MRAYLLMQNHFFCLQRIFFYEIRTFFTTCFYSP
nr:MAG TPA: hypothetical protein [Caudoviricetes sp.]